MRPLTPTRDRSGLRSLTDAVESSLTGGLFEEEDESPPVGPWPLTAGGWLAPNDDGRDYAPHRGQKEFHESRARFRILFGGRGSGKTTAGAQEALTGRIQLGLPGAVLNPDFENFRWSTWPEFRHWIPWDQVITADRRMGVHGWEPRSSFVIHFINGAVVYCKGLKDPEAARGPNLNWLWYDEGGRDRTGLAWKLAIAGVRIGPSPAAWVTTTPKGRRHWTAKTFVNQDAGEEIAALLEEAGHDGGAIFSHHTASINDNRDNLDPMFYAAMKSSYSGKFADQELDGLLVDTSEGLVYDNISADNITAAADYHPDRGAVELAYDDGFSSSPRAMLLIQRGEDGTINVFDELYHFRHPAGTCISEAEDLLVHHVMKHKRDLIDIHNLDDDLSSVAYGRILQYVPALDRLSGILDAPPENVGRLLDELDGAGNVSISYAAAAGDPSAAQFKAELEGRSIRVINKPMKVLERIKFVHNLIRSDEGIVRIRIHPRCEETIREFSEDYQYPEGSQGGDGVHPVKEDDHTPDALSYWVVSRYTRTKPSSATATPKNLNIYKAKRPSRRMRRT